VTYVTLYSLDTGDDILLGQDFVKRHMPLIVNTDSLCLTVQQQQIKLPMKTSYVIHISPDAPDTIEETLHDLTKIQKIVRHADIHGQEILKDTVQKLKDECTSDFPDAFWTRDKYFVSLPYKEGFKDTPQKASANNMSPFEQALCQEVVTGFGELQGQNSKFAEFRDKSNKIASSSANLKTNLELNSTSNKFGINLSSSMDFVQVRFSNSN
jgi:hypothetical protein